MDSVDNTEERGDTTPTVRGKTEGNDRVPRRLQKERESQFLERKSCFDLKGYRPRRLRWKIVAATIAETLVAFSNADGGELAVGLNDDGEVSGVPYGKSVIDKLIQVPQTRVRPSIQPQIIRFRKRGRIILLYRAGPSAVVHRTTDGKYLFRSRDQNMPMDADEIKHLKALKKETLPEHALFPAAKLTDIDGNLTVAASEKLGLPKTPSALLESLRLADKTNGDSRLTLAALLLFAKDPEKWHPKAYVEYLRFRGRERKHGKEFNLVKRERITAPLVYLPRRVFTVVKSHVEERHGLIDIFFEEQMEYPDFAWQEAVVNAIAHRDYGIRGTPIEIHHFDDRLCVVSPGGVVPPVSITKLRRGGGVHASRNPLLVRVLTAFGYMKEVGEGVPRMFLEMERAGLGPPEFTEETDGLFSVTLRNVPVWDKKTLSWLLRFRHLKPSQNQLRILVYAKQHGGQFTSAQYQRLVGIDIYSASSDIKDLIRKGLIAPTKKGGRVYLLSNKSALSRKYARSPEHFAQIQTSLQEKGFLTNRDLQMIWKVNRMMAWRRAKRLVYLGWLKRQGDKRGSRYVSGQHTQRPSEGNK